MKHWFFIVILTCLCLPIIGQKEATTFRCDDQAFQELNAEFNPDNKRKEISLKQLYKKSIQGQKKIAGIITLPVVVHVIHNNGIENISDAEILQGIENLNDAFRNLNYYDPSTGVDSEIEFCLAQRDTFGNTSSGIVRHLSSYTDLSIVGAAYNVANMANWDPTEYINVRLVKEVCIGGSCEAAGFASGPSSHGDLGDGIFMEASYFGSSFSNSTVTVHEIGHYLGLKHTFQGGCKNDDCLIDGDGVCDTPPDLVASPILCFFENNSCNSDEDDTSLNNPFRSISLGGLGDQNDPNNNYMDYAALSCYNQFTQGQKDRMLFFIEEARASLLNSMACFPSCPSSPAALFSASQITINTGEIVTFNNLSSNASNYQWSIDGVPFSNSNSANYQFLNDGSFAIQLNATNDLAECSSDVFEIIITVQCPVVSEFTSLIDAGWINLINNSISALNFNWTIYDVNSNVLFNSTEYNDSFNISGHQYIQICLAASDAYCQEEKCEYVSLIPGGIEICDNEVDDDDDGWVDAFDPDCECNNEAYQNSCPILCEYLPDSFPNLGLKLKWQSELIADYNNISHNIVLGDLDGNETIEVVTKKQGFFGTINNTNDIIILNGNDGSTQQRFNFNQYQTFNDGSFLSLANVDRANNAEILSTSGDTVRCYQNGNVLWETKIYSGFNGNLVNIADFNGDGIPEVYKGSSILNAENGSLLAEGINGGGCQFNFCTFKHSIAADLLPDPGLELAAGNTVYSIDINNPNGTLGNSITSILADSNVEDGLTSVGDIDGDGELDVIVVRSSSISSTHGIWVWNPRTGNIIATAESGIFGGIPFIGDVDGDCLPEIGMTFREELRMYKFNGSNNLQLLYSLPTSDASGITGISMFDFNQDGKNELVYRDETQLRILEGSTGNTLASYPVGHGTGIEYPVIADIDNDGEAEILVTGYLTNETEQRVLCFESALSPWAPARSVWNQPGYHVTNVNDDLTIPRYQQHQAKPLEGYEDCLRPTCPTPYNAFMAQATYRTQAGCVQWPAEGDLSITADLECIGDSVEICVHLDNPDSIYIENGFTGWCGTNPDHIYIQGSIVLLDSFLLTDSYCFRLPKWILEDSIFVSINNPSYPYSYPYPLNINTDYIPECDYSNNNVTLIFNDNPPPLDLGPDIEKCGSEVFTLYAGSGFESYLWNDGSVDSIYSSSFEGLHFVETTDQCGNIYRDTVVFTINNIDQVDLGPDQVIYPNEIIELSIFGSYDQVQWHPAGNINCETCPTIEVQTDTTLEVTVIAGIDNCFYSDTIILTITPPVRVRDSAIICSGNQYSFQDSILTIEGHYEWTNNSCDSLFEFDLTISLLDTQYINESICSGDSLLFGSSYLTTSGTYSDLQPNFSNCDSLTFLTLSVHDQVSSSDTIELCQGDSISLFGEFFYSDTTTTNTFNTPNGCDSIHSNIIIFNPLPTDQLDIELCNGDSVLIGNTWLSQAGSYQLIVDGTPDCDTLINVDIVITNSIVANENIDACQGDSISILGQIITSDTTITSNEISQNGCDSIHNYIVNFSPLPTDQLSLELCNGDSVLIGNTWLSQAGSYQVIVDGTPDCDTLLNVDIVLTNSINVNENIDACQGDTIFILGQLIPSDTTITTNGISQNGCDSIHSYIINFSPLPTDQLSLELCNGDSILIGNTWLSQAGNYQVILEGNQDCDTLLNVDIVLSDTININEGISACQGDTISILGQIITSDTTITSNAISQNGCDSIHNYIINFIPLPTDQLSLELCNGDSVLIGNTWLSQAGSYQVIVDGTLDCDTLINVDIVITNSIVANENIDACQGDSISILGQIITSDTTITSNEISQNGCDSIHNYIVNFSPLPTDQLSLELCNGDSVLIGNTWLSQAGSYQVIINGTPDCDTLINVDIVITNSIVANENIDACQGDSISILGQIITSDTTITSNEISQNGCDSIHNYIVNFSPLPTDQLSLELCNGDSVLIGNTWLSQAGSYQVIVDGTPDCDTLIDIDIVIVNSIIVNENIDACQGDSISILGQIITSDTTITSNEISQNGCDSIHNYIINFIPLPTDQLSLELCNGDSVLIGNTWLSQAGSYQVILDGNPDCDTLLTVNIDLTDSININEGISACQGDSISILGLLITSDTTITFNDISQNGCDSTHNYVIAFHQHIIETQSIVICEGDSILINNNWIYSSGSFTDTLNGVMCDSIIVTSVQLLNTTYSEELIEICPGDSIWIDEQWIHEPLSLMELYTNAAGCDSLHQITITKMAMPPPPSSELDCENLETIATIDAGAPWKALWDNGDTTSTTQYSSGGTIQVNLYADPNCQIEYSLLLPEMPQIDNPLTFIEDNLNFDSGYAISLNLEVENWEVFWYPTENFSCDSCFNTSFNITEVTELEVMLIHTSGCIYNYRFEVKLEDEIYVPNVFSPNGDNINDFWTTYNDAEISNINSILIYDRWGNTIVESKDVTSFTWDGTFKGKPMNPGVFIYYIDYTTNSGEQIKKSGDLTLMR